jgi:hypothetical protein
MKIIKLKESDLVNAIKNILNEQSGGSMIPENGYKAISDIESVYSFTDPSTGKITGRSLTGKEQEGNIKNYVGNTIGLDNWFKINELFRTQLYAYMYQTDSGKGGMRMWWIAGLAQAINPKINRATISKKKLDDKNVKQAIDLIKEACQNNTINTYYTKWLSVVDNQYSVTGSAHKDNYENVWKNRPKAIERLMNGESWGLVKKEFNSKTTTKQQPTQQPAAAPKQQQPVASKPVTAQGLGFLQLLEKVFDYKMEGDTATAFNIVSPLNAGRIDFKFSKGTYSCAWGLKPDEPYFDDNMKFQLVQRGGNITTTIVTGDGDKIPIDPKYFNGMSCRAIQ